MNEKLQKLTDIYKRTEKDIEKEIKGLPRYGSVCNCPESEEFKQIFSGQFEEIIRTCLRCGGFIEI